MPRKKKVEKIKTEEERLSESLEREIFSNEHLPTSPIDYGVGDQVEIGNLQDCIIKDVYEDRLFLIDYTKIDNNYGQPIISHNVLNWFPWTDIRLKSLIMDSDIKKESNLKINYQTRTISSLISQYYSFGIDTNPFYQRDYCWGWGDEILFIESIFNNIDIGKFVIIGLPYGGKYLYEILDGKQRLMALVKFFNSKFPINHNGVDYFYSNLSRQDKAHFDNYFLQICELEDVDPKGKLELFLRLNTTGIRMSNAHLDSVRDMLAKMEYFI